MSAIERLKKNSDNAKIIEWLDHIGEHDEACRQEVIDQCANDKDAMEYYLSRYDEDCKRK